MGIKHIDVKASRDKGYAIEWNKDHIIDSNVPFAKFESEEMVFHKGAVFPTGSVQGQPFYRTDEDLLYVYDGADWKVTNAPATLSDDTPQDVSIAAGAPGLSTEVSRSDHIHKYAPTLVKGQTTFSYANVPHSSRVLLTGSSITVTTGANDIVLCMYRCDGHIYGETGGVDDELETWLYCDGNPAYIASTYMTGTGTNEVWETIAYQQYHIPGAGTHVYSVWGQSQNDREDISNGVFTIIVFPQ
jgi:hypothetical protein